jgi:LysM repeat protein
MLAACGGARSAPKPSVAPVTRAPAATRTQTAVPPGVYIVQPGDTLDSIAAKVGVTPSGIAAMNPGLNPAQIRAGQRLVLPIPYPPPSSTPTPARAP